jgi:hypothetical protein
MHNPGIIKLRFLPILFVNINQTFLQQLKLGSVIENLHQKLSVPMVVISFFDHSRTGRSEEVPDYFLKTILRLPVANVNHLNTRNGKLLQVHGEQI